MLLMMKAIVYKAYIKIAAHRAFLKMSQISTPAITVRFIM